MSEQWWLAELDQYGNARLVDGAHGSRDGADRAAYLLASLGLGKGKRYAVAHVTLSEARPTNNGVDQEAIASLNSIGLSP